MCVYFSQCVGCTILMKCPAVLASSRNMQIHDNMTLGLRPSPDQINGVLPFSSMEAICIPSKLHRLQTVPSNALNNKELPEVNDRK